MRAYPVIDLPGIVTPAVYEALYQRATRLGAAEIRQHAVRRADRAFTRLGAEVARIEAGRRWHDTAQQQAARRAALKEATQ